MRTVVVKSVNLIGDCLYTSCAMRSYLIGYPDTELVVLTQKNHVTPIYSQFGLPIRVFTDDFSLQGEPAFDLGAGSAAKVADDALRANGEKLHMAQCLGRIMGVNVTDFRPTYRPVGELKDESVRGAIFISPFSMSCSSRDKKNPGQPPNKMLPWGVWGKIVQYLRTFDLPIRVLGAPDDRCPMLSLSEDEYYTGVPLNDVALALQYCKMLVTVDNGMHHIGATLGRPCVVFYPKVLPVYFMGSVYNRQSVIVHMDPAGMPSLTLFLMAKAAIKKSLELQETL